MTERWERELRSLRDAPAPLDALRERAQQPPRHESSSRSSSDRWIAGVVAIAVFAAAAVFVWEAFTSSGAAPADGPRPPAVSGPVTLWLSAERVPPGAELVAVLVDHEGVDATFGVHAFVDRWNGSEWEPYGEVVMCMDHWHCTARIVPPGEIEAVADIGLGARPGVPGPVERFTTGGLGPGWYRVSHTAYESVVARGIFEVAHGAQPPAPLVRVDASAISIAPVLLPPGGGEVTLFPLVPGESSEGGLSRDDLRRAVQGLPETALIQRWDGTSWVDVASVDCLRVPGDDLPRTAMLPPLDEGAYRLVRESPAGSLAGSFWVDESV